MDAAAETLEVLRLESDRWSIVAAFAGDDIAHAEPFDAVGLELNLLCDRSPA